MGDFDEAWKVFDDYLNGNFPVKTPVQNQLNHHIIKTWECSVIYRRMRVCSVRQKKYKDALIYRALDLFFDIGLEALTWQFIFCVMSHKPFGLHPRRMAYPTAYSKSEIYDIGTEILLLQ